MSISLPNGVDLPVAMPVQIAANSSVPIDGTPILDLSRLMRSFACVRAYLHSQQSVVGQSIALLCKVIVGSMGVLCVVPLVMSWWAQLAVLYVIYGNWSYIRNAWTASLHYWKDIWFRRRWLIFAGILALILAWVVYSDYKRKNKGDKNEKPKERNKLFQSKLALLQELKESPLFVDKQLELEEQIRDLHARRFQNQTTSKFTERSNALIHLGMMFVSICSAWALNSNRPLELWSTFKSWLFTSRICWCLFKKSDDEKCSNASCQAAQPGGDAPCMQCSINYAAKKGMPKQYTREDFIARPDEYAEPLMQHIAANYDKLPTIDDPTPHLPKWFLDCPPAIRRIIVGYSNGGSGRLSYETLMKKNFVLGHANGKYHLVSCKAIDSMKDMWTRAKPAAGWFQSSSDEDDSDTYQLPGSSSRTISVRAEHDTVERKEALIRNETLAAPAVEWSRVTMIQAQNCLKNVHTLQCNDDLGIPSEIFQNPQDAMFCLGECLRRTSPSQYKLWLSVANDNSNSEEGALPVAEPIDSSQHPPQLEMLSMFDRIPGISYWKYPVIFLVGILLIALGYHFYSGKGEVDNESNLDSDIVLSGRCPQERAGIKHCTVRGCATHHHHYYGKKLADEAADCQPEEKQPDAVSAKASVPDTVPAPATATAAATIAAAATAAVSNVTAAVSQVLAPKKPPKLTNPVSSSQIMEDESRGKGTSGHVRRAEHAAAGRKIVEHHDRDREQRDRPDKHRDMSVTSYVHPKTYIAYSDEDALKQVLAGNNPVEAVYYQNGQRRYMLLKNSADYETQKLMHPGLKLIADKYNVDPTDPIAPGFRVVTDHKVYGPRLTSLARATKISSHTFNRLVEALGDREIIDKDRSLLRFVEHNFTKDANGDYVRVRSTPSEANALGHTAEEQAKSWKMSKKQLGMTSESGTTYADQTLYDVLATIEEENKDDDLSSVSLSPPSPPLQAPRQVWRKVEQKLPEREEKLGSVSVLPRPLTASPPPQERKKVDPKPMRPEMKQALNEQASRFDLPPRDRSVHVPRKEWRRTTRSLSNSPVRSTSPPVRAETVAPSCEELIDLAAGDAVVSDSEMDNEALLVPMEQTHIVGRQNNEVQTTDSRNAFALYKKGTNISVGQGRFIGHAGHTSKHIFKGEKQGDTAWNKDDLEVLYSDIPERRFSIYFVLLAAEYDYAKIYHHPDDMPLLMERLAVKKCSPKCRVPQVGARVFGLFVGVKGLLTPTGVVEAIDNLACGASDMLCARHNISTIRGHSGMHIVDRNGNTVAIHKGSIGDDESWALAITPQLLQMMNSNEMPLPDKLPKNWERQL